MAMQHGASGNLPPLYSHFKDLFYIGPKEEYPNFLRRFNLHPRVCPHITYAFELQGKERYRTRVILHPKWEEVYPAPFIQEMQKWCLPFYEVLDESKLGERFHEAQTSEGA